MSSGLLVDVHAHLDYAEFEKDLDEVIERAKKAGVKVIIANGVCRETNRKVLAIAEKYDIVKAALGLYPQDALSAELHKKIHYDVDEEIEFIRKNKDRIVAIGEVGLDYQNVESKEVQREVFSKVIGLSNEIDMPLIVHSRKAEEDVINLLEKNNAKKAVLHCFCGKKNLILKAEKLGYYFSIPTNVVRAENIQGIVKNVSINRLLTETDAPFLSPFVGKRNEPAFIIEAVKKIAEIKGFTTEETEQNIFLNYKGLFEK